MSGCDSLVRVDAAGGRAIALQAGKVLIADREQTLVLADKLAVAVVEVE